MSPNSHLVQVRREGRMAIGCATVGAIAVAYAIAGIWLRFDFGQFLALGVIALAGFSVAHGAWQKARGQQTLGLEVLHGQRSGFYDVTVRLNPGQPIRLTRLTAVLDCAEFAGRSVGGNSRSEGRSLFIATEHLFEGRATLGHGEKLEQTVSFELPGALELTAPESVSIRTTLKLLAEVDGSSIVHEEGVTLDLPVRPQVTLSQM